ncbi:hypothetical protein [Cohnella panacarvi]|uniref:hypothetical protein n=1 Tax=Cohnella panacarvi TaxID=400776 RepID=UPI00047EC958|nr:hypothetical protein [Cohnella panacarvi]
MNKIKRLLGFFLLVSLCVSLFPAFASANQVSLLSGKTVQVGSSHTNYITTTTAVTDNNLATGTSLAKGVSDTSIKDTITYDFSSVQSIDSFKIIIAGYTNQSFAIVFYGANATELAKYNLTTFTSNDGVYELPQRLTGVRKVAIWNNHTAAQTVLEWDVYRDVAPISPELSASAGNELVSLNWNSTDARSYTIQRSTTAGGPYEVVADNVTSTSYIDSNVINGTTYYYVVVGKNNEGTSPISNEASATATVNAPNAPTNLTATGDNEKQSINLHWDSVTEATYYQVSRSTVAGGPYNTIVSDVTGTSLEDFDIVQGITYYYVVISVNQGVVSQLSNEASAKLEVPDYGRAILTIYIAGGQIKEYDLSSAELNAFISWYDAKDAGSGPSKFAFTKTWNKGPFKARTEYVIFDKILSFDVDEYDVAVEE